MLIGSDQQIAFWRFDDQGAVLYYDAWFTNLNDYTALLYGTAPNPTYDSAVIESLCTEAEVLCTGNNMQYTSKEDCVSTLSAKPFGEWDEAWGDNIVCRILHILLAKLRPDVSGFRPLVSMSEDSLKLGYAGALPPYRTHWRHEMCECAI